MIAAPVTRPLLLDNANPWPGLHEFNEASWKYFNGRNEEQAALFRLVRDSRTVVLFGRSGLGKTSLLHAGLFPRLRRENFLPIPVRLTPQDQNAPLINQVKNALLTQLALHNVDHPPSDPTKETLWEYLHRRNISFWSSRNYPLIPIFVFDQFEEVFTLGTGNKAIINQFCVDLTELIENLTPERVAMRWRENESAVTGLDLQSQRYKVIICLREDFLPDLENWHSVLPSLMRNRLRLLPMNGVQALEAVYKTGREILTEEWMAGEIVRFVAAAQGEIDAGGDVFTNDRMMDESIESVPLNNLVIEPALLSLICTKLNETRKELNKKHIDHDLLKNTGYNIISQFYGDCMNGIPETTRRFIEDELITEGGFRNSYPKKDAVNRQVISVSDLEYLVNYRLLRIEPRMGVDRIELVHDLLTSVVRENRDAHRKNKEEQRLREAEEAHKKQVADLAAKESEAKERAAVYQVQAESLVNFMLNDLKNKLEPIGKINLLAAVIVKCIDYYKSIPPSQFTDKTSSNYAIALRTLGDIEKARGKIDKAEGHYRDYNQIFKRLVDNEPGNVQWRRDLADSYSCLGDIKSVRGMPEQARKYHELCFQGFKNLSELDPENTDWQRELAVSYGNLGNIEQTRGNLDKAIEYFQRNHQIIKCLMDKDQTNTDWQQELAVACNKLGNVEQLRGNIDKAELHFRQFSMLFNYLAKMEPDNAIWQREVAASFSKLGSIEQSRGDPDKALEYYRQYLRITEKLCKKDPDNTKWQRDLAVSFSKLGSIEQSRKNLDQALDYFQQDFQITRRLSEKDPDNARWRRDLAVSFGKLGSIEQSRGNHDKALDYFRQCSAIISSLTEIDPSNIRWQEDLAIVYDWLSVILKKIDNLEQSANYSDQAVNIRKRIQI